MKNAKRTGNAESFQDGTSNTNDDRKNTDEVESVLDSTSNTDDDLQTTDKIDLSKKKNLKYRLHVP